MILIAIAIANANGAAKMGFLESLQLARLAAWLACVPMASPFFVFGILFGIWSLWPLGDL